MKIIDEFNNHLPMINEIIERYNEKLETKITNEAAQSYLNRMQLVSNSDDSEDEKNSIGYLIHETNLNEIGIGRIYFYSPLKSEENNILFFADFNEGQVQFGIDESKRIFVFLEELDQLELLFLQESQFIDFLIFYHKLNYDLFYRKKKLSALDKKRIDGLKLSDKTGYIIAQIFEELSI